MLPEAGGGESRAVGGAAAEQRAAPVMRRWAACAEVLPSPTGRTFGSCGCVEGGARWVRKREVGAAM